jgi:hypothetical protein
LFIQRIRYEKAISVIGLYLLWALAQWFMLRRSPPPAG